MSRRVFGLLLFSACTTSVGSAPEPQAVAPSSAAAGSAVMLTITGSDFFADVHTDFRHANQSAIDASFVVRLDQAGVTVALLTEVTLIDDHTLTAQVPAATPRGQYDVVVVDPEFRVGTVNGGFRLVTSAENVASFTFDPIDPQHASVPFLVGLTAVDVAGHTVEGFTGTAQIGSMSIGRFVLGRGSGLVTVAAPATGVVLTAVDALGHMGQSAPFDVTAGDAARIVFTAGPPSATAGDCAGPFAVQVQDTFGNPTSAASAVMFTAALNPPDGAGVFSDATCMTDSALGAFDAGQGALSLFVRATVVGQPQLRVVPSAWPSAERALDVDAGMPMVLAITSPPQVIAASMCSMAIVVQSQDAFGNASPLGADLNLTPDLEPSANVTLHSDAQCSANLDSLQISAAQTTAQFFFSSAVAAMLTLTVDGGVLGIATQDEQVTP